jgi:hypothetical protein
MKKMKEKSEKKNTQKSSLVGVLLLFRAHNIKSLSFYTREREKREILLLVLFFLSSTSERERERERERECNKSVKRITDKSPPAAA